MRTTIAVALAAALTATMSATAEARVARPEPRPAPTPVWVTFQRDVFCSTTNPRRSTSERMCLVVTLQRKATSGPLVNVRFTRTAKSSTVWPGLKADRLHFSWDDVRPGVRQARYFPLDVSGAFIIDTRGVAGARVYVRSEWTNRMGLVGAAGAGYFTVKGK